MNGYFVAAAGLTFLIGAVHSVFGERLVFRRMRAKGLIPVNGGTVLREGHVRILWASWHLVTVLGWCVAATLAWLALPANAGLVPSLPAWSTAVALATSALLVLVGTKGRHPGWIGLLVAAALTLAGMYVR